MSIQLTVSCRVQVKYVGDGEEQNGGLQMTGLNLMDKTLAVRGARLAFNIWDVAGDSQSADHVPIACKDAVAILFMFDLTSRCTLNKLVLAASSSVSQHLHFQAQRTTNSESIWFLPSRP
uniref:Uncharacterized protein n=1 Tax=Aegilops tauschii subsp. strangulata TaxID=200361 RepID=A0A453BDC2_AEGTS